MKTFRQNFEEDYAAVKEPCGNKRGFKVRYVYVGLWYGWDIGREELKRWKRRLSALCAVGICLLLLGGAINSPLNYAALVQIPAMFGLAAAVFEAFGVGQFCAAGERLDRQDFEDIDVKLRVAPALHGVLLGAACAAGLLEAIRRGGGRPDACVSLCFGLSAVLAFLACRDYSQIPHKKMKNEAADAAFNHKRESS